MTLSELTLSHVCDPLRTNPVSRGVMWGAFAVLIVTEIVLVCCEGVRRKHPLNLVVLFIFTCAMSLFAGTGSHTPLQMGPGVEPRQGIGASAPSRPIGV